METIRTNLLDIFYEHVEESDWLEGLDLYQAGKVNQLTDFSGLITAKVNSNHSGASEVRLKIHPSGKRIQWIECTCSKYRSSGRYCEHMAAFMINIDREKPQLFGHLDSKMPLKPPTLTRRFKSKKDPAESRSIDKLEGAAQTILSHLKGQIHSISLLAKGPGIRVRLEMKAGTITHYNLDLDSAAKFLLTNNGAKSASAEVKSLKVYQSHVMRGTYFYQEEDDDRIIAERVYAVRHNGKSAERAEQHTKNISSTVGTFTYYSDEPTAQGRKGLFEFLSVKSAGKFIGQEYIFLPERGYWPIESSGWKGAWNDLPLKKAFKGDEAAELLKSGFRDYLGAGTIWLDETLNNPTIMEDLAISEIKIHKADDGWFYLDPRYSSGDTNVSMVDLLKHFRSKKKNFLKAGQTWLKIPDFIKENDWDFDQTGQFLKVNAMGLMRFKAAVGDFDHFVGSRHVIDQIRERLEFRPGGDLPSLEHTKLTLRGYQQTGLEWLWWLYQNNLHGLLADEMGLGKTHQAMALMSAIQKQNKDAKFLVIAPTTVIDHWVDKIQDFAPDLKPLKHHGSKRLQKIRQDDQEYHSIVTSYGVLLRDAKILAQQNFEVIILDEAHFIKNNVTETYKAVCRLEGKLRVCLTGTPMENHLGELKNIFDFLMPGYLGSDEYFKKHFCQPIEAQGNTERELALQKLIHPFKMRRTKDLVLKDLPEKVEDYRSCELSQEQVRLYRDVLELKASPIVKQLQNENEPVPFLHVFHTLTLLKQICNHPQLVQKDLDYTTLTSGKFEVFKEILNEALGSDHKVVVYSQYVGMIDIFDKYLHSLGIPHAVLTGASRNRGAIIKTFQEDPKCKVFCGSLLAGGIGIDLTAASVVIHYDRWWNASKENQATDRVHRIGQHKNVQVLKMITRGTLEEKIDAIIKSKQSLFERFLDHDEEIFKKLDRRQLIELLS